MSIRPLHDRVIVTRLEEAQTIAFGIVIPDAAAAKVETGEVIRRQRQDPERRQSSSFGGQERRQDSFRQILGPDGQGRRH
jgi:co-chaperonin GroES (HSP10)